MYKLVLGGAAAAALLSTVPAAAQPVPPAAPQVQTRHVPMRVQTRDEVVQHVRGLFTRLDTNSDGFLTREEANAAKQAMAGDMRTRFAQRLQGGTGPGMPDRGAMFDRLDTNKDGMITRQEYVSAQPQVQERRMFLRREGGEPGKMRMHGMGGMHGKMFESADANRDGRVSLQEMTAEALQRFDSADANRDGKLTPEERMQMHRQRQAQRKQPA